MRREFAGRIEAGKAVEDPHKPRTIGHRSRRRGPPPRGHRITPGPVTKRAKRAMAANATSFKKGNSGGPGNPHAAHVGRIRAALLAAATEKAMGEVVTALIDAARGGDVAAARELFNRLLGPPIAADLIERLEAVERAQAASDHAAAGLTPR